MSEQDTCWTLIRNAACGDERARDGFVQRYLPAVRAYLEARWRTSALAGDVDDAAQDVCVDCLREGGALERSDPTRPFRLYLQGVTRTIALRFEERRARERQLHASAVEFEMIAADETSLSQVFDRAWAKQVMREAAELQASRAREAGGAKQRRVELLRLRFEEGLPIRAIAELWNDDAARLHHEFAEAREDFRRALRDTVATRHGCTAASADDECARMLALLGLGSDKPD